jgi:membrane protein DedA with SNARE-associated domain
MLDRLIAAFLSIPGPWVVGVVFFLSAAETALFVGFVVPGELTVILGGVLASRAHVPLPAVLAASVAGPILGDSIGYYLGRRYGENTRHKRLRKRWAKARSWVKNKGAPAVFLGRFVAFVRSFIPAAAGVSQMPYRKFLPWNAAAGILWGAGSALLGYFAGANFEAVAHAMGWLGLALLAVAIAVSAAIRFVGGRRRVKS